MPESWPDSNQRSPHLSYGGARPAIPRGDFGGASPTQQPRIRNLESKIAQIRLAQVVGLAYTIPF